MGDHLETAKLRHREESVRLTVLHIEVEWKMQQTVDKENQLRSHMSSLREKRNIVELSIETRRKRGETVEEQFEDQVSQLDDQIFYLKIKLKHIKKEKKSLHQQNEVLRYKILDEERAENEIMSQFSILFFNNNYKS